MSYLKGEERQREEEKKEKKGNTSLKKEGETEKEGEVVVLRHGRKGRKISGDKTE